MASEKSSIFYADFENDQCLIYELDYVSGNAEKVLNVTQELNEHEFFTVSKLEKMGESFLVVLDFD